MIRIRFQKKQAYIQLWHGVPLKRMGFLAKNIEKSSIEVSHKHWGKTVNYITSSSDTYDTLMSACEGITNDKFIHLGFPRNDFFLILMKPKKQDADKNLNVYLNQ